MVCNPQWAFVGAEVQMSRMVPISYQELVFLDANNLMTSREEITHNRPWSN